MTLSELLIPLVIAVISGSGGGLLGHWWQGRRETKAIEATSKQALRKQLDEAVGKALSWYPGEFERLVRAYDGMATRNDELLTKNDLLVEEIRVAYAALAETQALLSDTKAQLAVAQAEIDRKESVIRKLQELIEKLQAQVAMLQKRLTDCGGNSEVDGEMAHS